MNCSARYVSVLVFAASIASAQLPMLPASQAPRNLQGVSFTQNLNAQLPLELTFNDELNNTVRLGQYFQQKPVILALVYFQCPMLCNLELNGLVKTMRHLKLSAGDDYDVLAVSFDPKDNAQLAFAKKEGYLEKYGRAHANSGIHFLTGKEANVKALADSVGFHYSYDPATKQFTHASGIVVLTPEGKASRYLYGIDYPDRDLRLALVEASNHKIGSPVDAVMLFCFHYDPATGKYGLIIANVVRLAGSATVLALGTFVFMMIRRERRNGGLDSWRSA